MKSVRLFDFLQYDGQSWQVVAQDGPILALKNLTSGRIRKVPVAEMLGDDSFLPDAPDHLPDLDSAAVLETLEPVAEMLGDDSFLPDAPDHLPDLDSAAVLETLDPKARQRTEFLHRHVVEVLTGAPPSTVEDELELRSEYDLRNSLEARVLAKAAELAAAGTPLRTQFEAEYRGLPQGRNRRPGRPPENEAVLFDGQGGSAVGVVARRRGAGPDEHVDRHQIEGDPAGHARSGEARDTGPVRSDPVSRVA